MKKTNQSEVVSSAFVLVHTSHTHTAGLWWSWSSLASGPCQSGSRSSWPVWIQTGRLLRNVKRPGVIHTTDATYGNISQKTAETEWIGISYTCICAGPSLKTCRSNSITRCVWVSWVSASSATFRSFSIIAEMSVITPRVQMQFPCHSALGAGETNERWAPWSNSTSKRSCASCWWGRQKLAEKMDQWSWRKVNLKSYFQIRTQLSIAFQSWKALALRIKLAREDQDLSARQAFLVAAEHQAHLQLHTCTTLKWKTFYSWKGGRMW